LQEAQSRTADMPQQQEYRSQLQAERLSEREQPHRSGGRSSAIGDSESRRTGSHTFGKGQGIYGSGKAVGLRSSSLLGGKPTAEDMRKAVLWAEVLGPPRSKRRLR